MFSWLKDPSRPTSVRRQHSRIRRKFVPQVTLLEDRCLLSSSILGNETLVNTKLVSDQVFNVNNDRSMDVASDGTAIVAWADKSTGIIARRIGADGLPLGAEFQVSSPTDVVVGNANVAVYRKTGVGDPDRVVVTWTSRTNTGDNSGAGIFGRLFAIDGTPLTDVFRVNATTPGDQYDSSVDWISPNQFVVAWCGAGQGEKLTVFVRIFDVGGNPVSTEIRVPETRTGDKRDPTVLALPTGGFQVAWSGNGPGDVDGIFSRQFTSTGQKLGSTEFRVNLSTASSERQPTLARSDSQVVVAWQSANNSLDRNGSAVVARLFNLTGIAKSGEFLVNENKSGNQTDPSIAFMADGGFTVAWRSSAAGTDGIFQREFNADGTSRFGERRVNAIDSGTQLNPTIRPQGPDGYVVVWDGNVRGDTRGIGMQRYGDPFMPAITSDNKLVGDFREVLYLDPSVPMKTFTLYNSSNLTIYPILEDANASAAKDKTTGLYDPYDPLNQEFRGYIGYKDPKTGKFYLGLRPGETFTFQVPLVFWDGGRMHITTDAHYLLTPTGVDNPQPNPFKYYDVDPFSGNPQSVSGSVQVVDNKPTKFLTLTGDVTAKLAKGLSIASSDGDLFDGTTIVDFHLDGANTIVELSGVARAGGKTHNYTVYKPTARFMEDSSVDGSLGRIMWYHARAKTTGFAEQIGLDAPTQLTEFTIRDPFLGDSSFKTGAEIASTEKVPLINYDVSYVDSMVLPVAMEATDVQAYPQQRYLGTVQVENGSPTNKLILKDPHLSHLLNFKDIAVTSDSGDLPHGTMVDHVEDNGEAGTIVFLTKAGNPNAGKESNYTFTHPQPTAAFGWTGAAQSFEQMQAAIKKFTLANKPGQNLNGLGLYFADASNPDGNGYPEWFNPDVTLSGIKLPSGQNLPGQSPLKAEPGKLGPTSNFDSNEFILTSSGVGPIRLSAGGSAGGEENTGPNDLYLNFDPALTVEQREAIRKQLIDGAKTLVVTATNGPQTFNLPKIKTVGALDQNKRFTVTLDGPTGLAKGGYTFSFTKPINDYASTKLAQIWYSWAKHYVDAVTATFGSNFTKTLTGGVLGKLSDTQPSNALTFTGKGDLTKQLAAGMVVTTNGDNFPKPTADDPIPRVTILDLKYDLQTDKTTIFLDKLPTGFGNTSVEYKFALPVMLSDPAVKTFELSFTKNADEAELFAKSVYQVMEAMSTIKLVDNQGPAWLQLLTNCIGGNLGFIKDIGIQGFDSKHAYKFDTPLGDIPSVIRDKIKSILRGVWNFTDPNFQEDSGKWYPDPSLTFAATGQKIDAVEAKFNVLNLDPFVWFVHKELGLSGYGFSLDDDVADIGAPGASKLAINIGGLKTLPQQAEWTWGAPFGPVNSQAQIATYQSGDANNGLKKLIMLDTTPVPIGLLVHGADAAVGPGALVYGPGIPLGTRVFLPLPFDNQVILTTRQPADTAGKVGPFNFRGKLPSIVASPVTGKSATLRVVGVDDLFGEGTWKYTWSLLHGPAGVTAAFTPNGTNAAKKATMTLSTRTAGTYLFRVTITGQDGSQITSEVDVTVPAG